MTTDQTHLQRRSNSTASASSAAGSIHSDTTHHVRSPEHTEVDRSKAIGACMSCRRSKVKCDHDGAAPCRRCRNGGYECTFKPKEVSGPQLQDEWRTKTDETLSKLVSTIDALVRQQESSMPNKRRRTSIGPEWSEDSRAGHVSSGSLEMHSDRGHYSSAGAIYDRRPSLAPAFSGTFDQPCGGSSFHQRDSRLNGFALTQSSLSHTGSASGRQSIAAGHSSTLGMFVQAASNGTTLTSDPGYGSGLHLQTSPSLRCSLPLPDILLKRRSVSCGSASKPPLVARASQYRYPDPSLGSNDPRLDAIRLGLVSCHEARSLFSLYAKTIEPLGFGFPDFPASSELTPVLLSAITSVASLHSSSHDIRSRQLRLRADVLDRTMPFAPVTAEDEFNPESGIGTEEVVGACIWSSYQGSEEAWKVARAARWWSEKYSYETGPQAGLTVGEMVAILPPVRHVTMQDRVRVWLTAFVAELHQCEIHKKEPIMQLIDPAQYSQALMSAAEMAKQDAALVFYSRVAYLVTKASIEGTDPERLLEVTKEITASWCTTRALLGSDPERRDVYDHAIDLHYRLAKASVLIRACRIYEEKLAGTTLHGDVSAATASFVSCSEACQHACMDSIKLLLSTLAGFVGTFAALPSICHFWIAQCTAFSIQLCAVDGLHYRLGLLGEGQLEEILGTVEVFMRRYLAELGACSTTVMVEEREEEHEIVKHPAMDAAVAMADLLASVRATV